MDFFFLFQVFILSSKAGSSTLSETILNGGIDFGGLYSRNVGFDSMLSMRVSLVQHIEPKDVVRLTDSSSIKANQKEQPWRWRGVYLRWERPVGQDRFVAGYGSSFLGTVLGYELGVIGLPDFGTQRVEYGAEIGGVLTVGVFGLYVRENVFFTDQLTWETQAGVRLVLPISLILK